MPTRSQPSLNVTAFSPGRRRLEPGPELGEIEAALFRMTVSAVPLEHFSPEDVPILSAYCRACVLERHAAEELAAGAVVGDRTSPWLSVHASAVRSLSTLAMRLRLGPRARDHHTRTTKAGVAPSAYDSLSWERTP